MKRYFVNHFPEQTASLGVRTSPAISSPSRLLRNPMSNNQSNSDHEERNHYFTLQCFSVAGLMEILSSKPHDDENKQQLGEGKIIEMIKMAKLCHEVWFLRLLRILQLCLFLFLFESKEERVQEIRTASSFSIENSL